MWLWILLIALLAAALLIVAWFFAWRGTRLRYLRANSLVAQTSRGPVEYARQGTGPVVLVLHGGLGGWDQALFLGQDLRAEARFTVLAPSRVGYLRTPLETGATPEEGADAMAALMDKLGMAQAAVIGLSGGGPTALAMALRHPHRVRALVMMAAITGRHTQPKQTTNEWAARVLFSGAADLLLDFATWLVLFT